MELVNQDVIANTELNPGLRADFLRLELLFNHGGVYADVDMVCEQSIEPLLEMAAGRFTLGISNTQVLEVNNGVMLSSKGHPFLKYLIENVALSFAAEFKIETEKR